MIKSLLKKNGSTKAAETLLTAFGMDIDDFPQIVENKKIGAVRFFLGSYLQKKPSHVDYRGLDWVEDLFKGLPEYLVIVCDLLFKAGKIHEAKGIFIRHNLSVKDFNTSF